MRVLHLIDSGGLYGAEQVLLGLASEQAKRDIEVAIGSIARPGEPPKAIEQEGARRGLAVKRIELPTGFSPGAVIRLRSRLGREPRDVLHAHGYKASVLTALLPRWSRGRAAVATLHGWTSTSRWTRNALYERLERMLLWRFDGVAAVSARIAAAPGVRGHRNLAVIANGIDLRGRCGSPVSGMMAELADFCRRKPTVLAVGRLSPEKNFETAIRAVARVRRAGDDVQLLLVGEGSLRGELERLASQLGLGEAVRMPGYLADASFLFSEARALIVTSLTEGLPMVVLEAMNARLPIVATPVGEIPKVLRGAEGGWPVRIGPEIDVAEAITAILSEPGDVAQRTESAFGFLQQRYTAGTMADAYARFYASAIK